jgi:hypothetical protein
MATNDIDIIAIILSFLTAIAALSAVILAILTEIRAQKRFKQGNEIQEKIAASSVKPLLTVNESLGLNGQVVLLNEGLGPAIMTEIVFRKDGRQGNSIYSVFDPAFSFQWHLEYKEFTRGASYMSAGQRVNLLFFDIDDLRRQGLMPRTIDAAVRALSDQITGIEVSIHYEDVLGNRQPHYEATLGEN